MAQIQFLTAEPADRILEYQEKWRRVDLGTQPNRVVTDFLIRQRAADLGAKIQAENGITNAVRVIGSIEQDTTDLCR
jgi:hypothetical protein